MVAPETALGAIVRHDILAVAIVTRRRPIRIRCSRLRHRCSTRSKEDVVRDRLQALAAEYDVDRVVLEADGLVSRSVPTTQSATRLTLQEVTQRVGLGPSAPQLTLAATLIHRFPKLKRLASSQLKRSPRDCRDRLVPFLAVALGLAILDDGAMRLPRTITRAEVGSSRRIPLFT